MQFRPSYDTAFAFDAAAERPLACDHCGQADAVTDARLCERCEDLLAADAPTADELGRECDAWHDTWEILGTAEARAAYDAAYTAWHAAEARERENDRIGRFLRVATWGGR